MTAPPVASNKQLLLALLVVILRLELLLLLGDGLMLLGRRWWGGVVCDLHQTFCCGVGEQVRELQIALPPRLRDQPEQPAQFHMEGIVQVGHGVKSLRLLR